MKNIVKDRTITTRVTQDQYDEARQNLERQGITLSEYLRLCITKAANDEVKFVTFLDSKEAKEGKVNMENDIGTTTTDFPTFEKLINDIKENES